LDEGAHHYGLALALGAAEVDLLELTNAYRAIANGGTWTEATYIAGEGLPAENSERDRLGSENLFSRETAYLITHILSTNASRIKAFGMDSPLNVPFACAAKTGTSKNFRDNWCIGFTKEYTVGVWVGNFDGSAMHGVSGISGAAPLFRDIMMELHRDFPPSDFEEPPTLEHRVICGRTGRLAGEDCPSRVDELFMSGTAPAETCSCQGCEVDLAWQHQDSLKKGRKILIVSPQNGDIYKIDPQIPLVNQRITFKMDVDTAISSVVVDLDGETIWKRAGVPYEFTWEPKPGAHRLTVKAAGKKEGYEETISFRVY
jgi:penicillin-binding protein 1C